MEKDERIQYHLGIVFSLYQAQHQSKQYHKDYNGKIVIKQCNFCPYCYQLLFTEYVLLGWCSLIFLHVYLYSSLLHSMGYIQYVTKHIDTSIYRYVCTSQKKLKLRLFTFLPEICANSCLTPGITFFHCVTLIHSVDASSSFFNTDEEFASSFVTKLLT